MRAHPEDPTADHLTGSRRARVQATRQRREARREVSRMRTLESIRHHGNGYRTATHALRSQAERLFGSWAAACEKAGVEPPRRGRPRKEEA